MNQLIITADLIRRFPFAVSPHRITDEMEILIARDMANAAELEGHCKRLPPSVSVNQYDGLARDAKAQAAVFRRLAAGDRTVWQMMQSISLERAAVDRALTAMTADGRVIKSETSYGKRTVYQYALNPNYMPQEAAE